MSEERRAFARVQVALAVRYATGDLPEIRQASVENISRGGVLLVVGADDVPEGGKVRINFQDDEGNEHVVTGRVVRTSPEGLVGVTFLEVDDRTFDYVEAILAQS